MRRVALLSLALPLVLACKPAEPQPREADPAAAEATKTEPEPTKPASKPARAKPATPPLGPNVQIANLDETCARTLCIAGPGEPTTEPNLDLGELCRQASGVLRTCEGEACKSAWPLANWRAGLDALIGSLDLDANGTIDEREGACSLRIAAYSTGAAIATTELVPALLGDPRMAAAKPTIERLVLVAPYFTTPAPAPALTIPAEVRTAFVYRHTKSPADDCSTTWEAGPWRSPAPKCSESTTCFDYDYSYEPGLAFVTRRGARSGAAIDHCNIMAAVAKIGLDNLERGIEAEAEHVPRFSDGRPAGRPHDPH